MVTWAQASFVIYLCQLLAPISESSDENPLQEERPRQKRGAVYPAGTVLQFSVALAYPIEIPKRKAATNLGILVNIDLPFNITQLYPYTPETIQARALSHNALYDDFEQILEEHGFNGKECILKSICQIARRKSDQDDLSYNLLQLLFQPRFLGDCSNEKCALTKKARVAGILHVDCNSRYKMCPTSFLDLITS